MNRRGDSRPISLIISFFVIVILVIFSITWVSGKFVSSPKISSQRVEASVLFSEMFSVLWREMNSPALSDEFIYSDPRTNKPLPFIPAQNDAPFCVVYSESKESGLSGKYGMIVSDSDVDVCLGGCSELKDKSGTTVFDCNGGTISYAQSSRFSSVFYGVNFFTKEVRFSDKLLLASFKVGPR